jgi:hypothetical protein
MIINKFIEGLPMSIFSKGCYLLIFCLQIGFTVEAADTIWGPQPDWCDDLNFEEMEKLLYKGRIVQSKDIRAFLKKSGKVPTGLHPIRIVQLDNGVKAVVKESKACYGEVAAYKAAKFLGIRLVPPTILQDLNGGKASFQFYVASPIDLKKISPSSVFQGLSKKDVSDKDVFYYIFGQWDTHPGNQMVSKYNKKHHLALIDNAGILRLLPHHKMGVQVIFASTLKAITALNEENLREIWSGFYKLNPARCDQIIRLILQRRDNLLQLINVKKTIKVIKD